jgi:hypothetical protein
MDYPYPFAEQLYKNSALVTINPRKTPMVHGMLDHIIFEEEELEKAKKDKHLHDWQEIADYMAAARPHQLESAKVFAGRTSPDEFIKQIHAHKKHDSWLERVLGTRDLVAQEYGSVPAAQLEQMGASYHPYANSVLMHHDSPGALIHELGHGVDLAPRQDESPFWRSMRWRWKPTLWKEHSAWRKGRKAYQEGFASSPEREVPEALERYIKNMQSYNARKYPAYGTYVGGGTGSVLGAGLGLAGMMALAKETGVRVPYIPLLGAILGGTAGVYGGAGLGKWWSNFRRDANKKKALKQLEALRGDPRLGDIAIKLEKMRKRHGLKRPKPKKKKKEERPQLAKAAQYAAGPASSGYGGSAMAGGASGMGVQQQRDTAAAAMQQVDTAGEPIPDVMQPGHNKATPGNTPQINLAPQSHASHLIKMPGGHTLTGSRIGNFQPEGTSLFNKMSLHGLLNLTKQALTTRGDFQGIEAFDSISDTIGLPHRMDSQYDTRKWDEYRDNFGYNDQHQKQARGGMLSSLGKSFNKLRGKLPLNLPAGKATTRGRMLGLGGLGAAAAPFMVGERGSKLVESLPFGPGQDRSKAIQQGAKDIRGHMGSWLDKLEGLPKTVNTREEWLDSLGQAGSVHQNIPRSMHAAVMDMYRAQGRGPQAVGDASHWADQLSKTLSMADAHTRSGAKYNPTIPEYPKEPHPADYPDGASDEVYGDDLQTYVDAANAWRSNRNKIWESTPSSQPSYWEHAHSSLPAEGLDYLREALGISGDRPPSPSDLGSRYALKDPSSPENEFDNEWHKQRQSGELPVPHVLKSKVTPQGWIQDVGARILNAGLATPEEVQAIVQQYQPRGTESEPPTWMDAAEILTKYRRQQGQEGVGLSDSYKLHNPTLRKESTYVSGFGGSSGATSGGGDADPVSFAHLSDSLPGNNKKKLQPAQKLLSKREGEDQAKAKVLNDFVPHGSATSTKFAQDNPAWNQFLQMMQQHRGGTGEALSLPGQRDMDPGMGMRSLPGQRDMDPGINMPQQPTNNDWQQQLQQIFGQQPQSRPGTLPAPATPTKPNPYGSGTLPAPATTAGPRPSYQSGHMSAQPQNPFESPGQMPTTIGLPSQGQGMMSQPIGRPSQGQGMMTPLGGGPGLFGKRSDDMTPDMESATPKPTANIGTQLGAQMPQPQQITQPNPVMGNNQVNPPTPTVQTPSEQKQQAWQGELGKLYAGMSGPNNPGSFPKISLAPPAQEPNLLQDATPKPVPVLGPHSQEYTPHAMSEKMDLDKYALPRPPKMPELHASQNIKVSAIQGAIELGVEAALIELAEPEA